MGCPIVLQDTLVDIQFVDKRYFPELALSTCREMACPKTITLVRVLTGPFIDCWFGGVQGVEHCSCHVCVESNEFEVTNHRVRGVQGEEQEARGSASTIQPHVGEEYLITRGVWKPYLCTCQMSAQATIPLLVGDRAWSYCNVRTKGPWLCRVRQ